MEYEVGNYYEFNEHGKNHCIRFINKIDINKYKYFDLLTSELITKSFEEKDLVKVYEKGKIEHLKTIPFGRLKITICRISELKSEPNKGKMIFKKFIDKLIINLNSSLELNLIDSKYYFEGNILDNKIPLLVEDDINDFFNKIEELRIPLTIEQKDNFLIQQFS